LQELFIVDTSLYYYSPESLDEAYFLLGYLNSNVITDYVNKVGSTGANGSLRNIHKHPFDYCLPKFDSNDQNHLKLKQMAQQTEYYVNAFLKTKQLSNDKAQNEKMIKRYHSELMKDNEYQKKEQIIDELIKKILKL
jgi:hypothetical protein